VWIGLCGSRKRRNTLEFLKSSEMLFLGGFLVYSVLEYFLGKSTKIKSNSIIEVILTIGRILYGRYKARTERND